MDARGKFGEHEKCVRVARGAAESSSFSIALQISQIHPQLDIRTAKSMSKFFHNRATTRICAKKPFIVIECKILTTHKKSKQTSLLLVRNTPRFILWFERENLSQLTDNCERKAQNLRRKWRKSKSKNSRITEKYFTSQRPEVIKTNSRNA